MNPFVFFAICAVALVTLVVAAIYYAAYSVRSQLFGPTAWRGRTDTNSVALTFDDGPSAGTAKLLDVLRENNVKATFFLIGKQVEKFPRVAQRIVAEGHEIGNHSFSHKIFLYCSRRRIELELNMAQEIITNTTKVAPRIVRPPCGVRTRGYFNVTRKLRLKTIQWTTAGFDWKKCTAEQIAQTVVEDAGPGAIILLHDGDSSGKSDRKATIDSIPLILAGLNAKNLEIVSLKKLLSRPDTNEDGDLLHQIPIESA